MLDQSLRRGLRPAAVRDRIRGTWMRHLRVLDQQSVQGLACSRLGVTADADDGADAERLDHDAQELVALLVHRRHDLIRQFFRDDVPTLLGVLEEQQRAIIMDQVLGEESLGLAETFLEQTPEAATADLGSVAGEAGDLLARMLFFGTPDRHLQPHPVADGGDLAERHAGLGHAERSGIHPQEEHLLRPGGGISTQIGLVRSPRVVQRLVDVVRGRGECSPRQGFP